MKTKKLTIKALPKTTKPKKIVADPKEPGFPRRAAPITSALPPPKRTSKPFTGRRRRVTAASV